MNRAYPNKINWTNEPSHATPIDETNLGLMDEAIYEIDGRVVTHDSTIASQGQTLQNHETEIGVLEDGKVDKVTGKGLSTNDFTGAYKSQIETNQAGVQTIFDRLETKVDKVTGKGLSTNDFTNNDVDKLRNDTYTKSETRGLVSKAYHPSGSINVEDLTASILISANLNNVYNLNGDGTTSNLFIEGAGHPLKDGTNIGVINFGTEETPNILFDDLGGFVDLSDYATISAMNTALADKVDKVNGKGLSTNDFTDYYKSQVDANASNILALSNGKVDKIQGKGLSTNDFTDYYKSQVDTNASNILTLFDNKVNKVQGKGLSTNDFTDNYKKGISISQELAYDKSREYIPSSDADFHNVSDGEIFMKDGITYGIHSIIQNPKTKEYIYTLSYSGHSTHGYAFAIVKDPTSDRDDWNIIKPSGIVAHQTLCAIEEFDGSVIFYSVYHDTSGEEQVSTLIYSYDLYEWTEMDVESVTIRLYQMGNNAFCYTDKLYEIDGLQILPTDLPYEPLKIAYGGGRLVVLTSNRSIYMSYDGIQWELKGTSIYSGDIIYGNGIFLIYSYEEDTVYVSKDGGYIWETQSVTVYNGDNVNPAEREVYEYYFPFREIGYAGGIFFGTANYHKQGQSLSEDLYGIWTSKDGYNWEITATDIEEEYKVTDNLYNETYIINTKNNLYYPTLSVGDAIGTKVDKVSGKGLSTNDYTNAEKQKNADNASAISNIQEDIAQSLSATGNPLTIESSESNLVECVAEVEAVQDLHGYDHPWVGGAGKNLIPMTVSAIKAANSGRSWSGNVCSMNNITLTLVEDADGNLVEIDTNGTPNDTVYFFLASAVSLDAGTYTVSSGVTDSSDCYIYNDNNGLNSYNSPTHTFSSSSSYPSYIRISSGKNVSGYKFKPQLESGSSKTSFEPYTNICPITGQTEVVIEDVGKNWFDKNAITDNAYLNTENANTSPNNDYCVTDYIPISKGQSIHIPATDTTRRWFYNSAKVGTTFLNSKIEQVFTATEDGYIRVSIHKTVIDINTFQINYIKTYTIQLGDTIYGGKLDVIRGKLVITHGEIDLGDLAWTHRSEIANGIFSSPMMQSYNHSSDVVMLSSCYEYEGLIGSAVDMKNKNDGTFAMYSPTSDNYLYVKDTRYTDATTFKTAVTGQTLVYELAEPYTIQLTPQQIRMLKGTNNISCNTGDLSIKYYPDNVLGQLKGDIEKGLNAYYDYQIQALWDKIGELQA